MFLATHYLQYCRKQCRFLPGYLSNYSQNAKAVQTKEVQRHVIIVNEKEYMQDIAVTMSNNVCIVFMNNLVFFF